MEELAKELETFKDDNMAIGKEKEQRLQEASKKWACFCLDAYADELLPKALGISIAISAYLKEIEMLRTK